MILLPEPVNNRQIFYLDIKDDLTDFASASLKNWVLFVIEDNIYNPILLPFAEMCIDKELLYMNATGKACSEIDDLFDHVMVIRELEGRKLPSWYASADDVLMTTWDYDLDEGFWFITSVAEYEELLIDTVVVANLTTKNYLQEIKDLAKKINRGWLPPD